VIAGAAVALARRGVWPYLDMAFGERRHRRTAVACSFGRQRMAQPISAPQIPDALPPARRAVPAVAVGGVALGIILLFGALVLWFHYGTAVFFEMIASGISACF
jgi:hypothetical protein